MSMNRRRLLLRHEYDKYIHFEDKEVERICLENWDKDGDGKLSMEEAAAVNSIGTKFYDNLKIESFDELVWFKSSQLHAGMFKGCKKLKYISVPPIPFGIFNDNVNSYERVRLCGEWKHIPDYFFWGLEKRNLKAIIIENCIPPKITNISGFFYGNHTTNFAKIYVPDDSVEKYREAAVWKDYKEFIYPLSEYKGNY